MLRNKTRFAVGVLAAAVFVFSGLYASRGLACPASARNKILKYNKKAMEDYDLLEFESAKQTLLDAQAIARRKGCDEHSVNAKTYVNLAVLYIQGFKDEDRGKLMFRRALNISKNVTLDRQVATPKLLRIFNSVKKTMGVRVVTPREVPRETPRPREVEPEKPAKGLEHQPMEEAPRNTPLTVKCRVGNDLKASKVIMFYKVVGQEQFQPLALSKATEWTWKATIPAGDVRGRSLYYYIEVRHGGKPQAASGNAASPHIIMLTEPKAGSGKPAENPFSRGGGSSGGGGPRIKKQGPPPGAYSRLYLALGGGFQTGYVGKWPGDLSVTQPRTPGFAMGTYGGQPEIGYFLKPSMLLSAAFKIGVASSDKSERPVLGWEALIRFRYVALGAEPKSLFKFYVGGELGVGDIYHVLELDGQVDSFRSGPGLILGLVVGIWLGTETVAGFLEIDPKGVIDFTKDRVDVNGSTVQHGQQHTFSLGITAGVAFRFWKG